MLSNFDREEKELLEVFLNQRFFTYDRQLSSHTNITKDFSPPTLSKEPLGVELIIRPECNQKCEYCYITQYGDKLYPHKDRLSNEQILKNIRAILDYFYNTRKVFIDKWELFAGDLFYDNLFFDIMDLFIEFITPLYSQYRFLFLDRNFTIVIPCNCSFVQNKEKRARFIEYRQKLSDIGVDIFLSYSGDGKYATSAREKKQLDDEYYDTLFTFLSEQGYLCHPMISVEALDNYIENYNWWVQQYKKYYKFLGKKHNDHQVGDFQPMFLEVRNDNWTTEDIHKYCELLRHIVQVRLEMSNNSIDKLAYHLFKGDGAHNTLYALGCNDPITIKLESDLQKENLSCSLQGLLHINVSNLTVAPCHRLTYPQFTEFHFETDDKGNIVDTIPDNLNILLATSFSKFNESPKCSNCYLKNLCIRGCLGAQYESSGDLFLPAESVCKMLKNKYITLIQMYFDMGVIDSAVRQHILSPAEKEQYKKILQQYRYEQEEKPWISIKQN